MKFESWGLTCLGMRLICISSAAFAKLRIDTAVTTPPESEQEIIRKKNRKMEFLKILRIIYL